MSNTLGRISGPMLKANLERFGVDLAFENDLLYLDVNTGKVGMKTSTVPRELTLDGDMITTNLIVDAGLFQVGDIIIDGSTGNISTVGNVPITFDPDTDQITLSILKTPNIVIDNNRIADLISNESIIFRAHGSGQVQCGPDDSSFTDTLVSGDLHSQGDITLDGDISFGDSSLEDAIQINAEIGSDVFPTVTDLYDLGSPTRKWLNVHTRLVRGELLTTTNFSVPGITTISARPGNTWYVSSVNGDDANQGDHQMGPYKTIKHALSQATAGDMVYIYAGNYEEYFPLTVPKGVTVQGEGIRSVKIYPHTSNNDKDAFLLNGETTVENLTVADFYYNNSNDTGYAFRFANNFQVDERSPYIRNISVITRSDSSLESSGRGALVDGSVATQYSKEASMLFHSVTFITPGSIALFMKNGVRVEWLNSFTYFASRGLYAVNGAFGRLTPDGSTIKYGAELRSIGSANVYGNVGAEADGNQCLMYLINHNFAYVGTGTDVENDPTLVDQTKETIEVNSGKIYYQSSDHSGDFRVGEAFVVEQDTGFITANGIGGGAQGASNISFSDGVNNTEIDASSVDTGNIQLTQNNINTIGGDLNVTPASGSTTLDSNVDIQDTLTVDGDMVVTGAISFGDSTQQGASTTFSFNAPVSIDLEPTFTRQYNIGSDALSWKNVFSVKYTSDDIHIFQNKIFTTTSSSNLELDAAGTGKIVFNSPLVINNNFTSSDTSLKDVAITGNLLHTGDLTQTGNKVVTGDYTLSGFLNLNDIDVPFDQIAIEGNRIRTTESNADLELTTSGTGRVVFPNNDVRIINNPLDVAQTIHANDITANSFVVADSLLTDGLEIFQNNIVSTSNNDIELRTSGTTDNISFYAPVDIEQDLTANSGASLTLSNTVINGNVTLTGPANFVGNTQLTGGIVTSGDINADSIFFDNISIDNNVITTTESNSNLELRPSGTGKVIINDAVTVENTIEIKGALDFDSLTAQNSVSAGQFYTDQILIQENFITTTSSNGDLELRASGTGTILVPDNNIQVDTNLTVSTDTDVQNTTITGTLNHIGSRFAGDLKGFRATTITDPNRTHLVEYWTYGGLRPVPGNPPNYVYNCFVGIWYEGELLESFQYTQHLRSNDPPPPGAFPTSNLTSRVIDGKIYNFETTAVYAIATYRLYRIEKVDDRYSSNYNQTGNYNLTGDVEIDGYLQLEDIGFDNNVITTTLSNSNLELRASGTGKVTVNDTNVSINENLVVVGDIFTTNANITNTLSFDRLEQNEIILDNNYITTSTSNTDLELRASGTGKVLIDDDLVVENNVDADNLTVPSIISNNVTVNGNVLQNGNTVRNGTTTLNDQLTVNDNVQFENIKIDDNVITTTDSNSDLEFRANGTGNILIDQNVTVGKNIEVLGDVNLAGDFTVSRINFNSITDGNILVDDNFITTTLSNSDLELRANGAGILLLDSNNLEINEGLTVLGNTDLQETNITGTVTQTGNTNHTGNLTNNGKVNIGRNFVTEQSISFSNIQILNNVITTSESNSDLEFRADGSGKVVTDSDTFINQQLNVDGTLTAVDLNATKITADIFQTTDDIRISGNTVETTVSNSNLEFRSTTGTQIDDLTFSNNTISSAQNIVLSPNGNLDLTNTNLVLPIGPSSTRSNQPGEIRYDSTVGRFSGYVAGIQPFDGIFSSNLRTNVTASDSRFFNGNGTINFVVNNVDVGHIDSQGIKVHGLQVDDVIINGNTFTSTTNSDINITPNGTGTTVLGDTTITSNEFTNQNTTDPMILSTTANGYVKFGSTTGVVMPTGDNSQRPTNPEVGEIRYNNQQGTPEVWNGTTWATWAGNSVTASEAEIDEISNIMAILLG